MFTIAFILGKRPIALRHRSLIRWCRDWNRRSWVQCCESAAGKMD